MDGAMNGCTFATEGANNPLVIHSNHANKVTEQIDQGRIDQDIQGLLPGGAAAVLRRNDYKPPAGVAVGSEDYKVTIVGIRKPSGWEFHYQKYKQDLADKPGGGSHLVNTAADRRVRIL